MQIKQVDCNPNAMPQFKISPQLPERRLQEGGIRLLSLVTSDRKHGNGLQLCQGRFRMGTRNNLFMGSVVRNWNGLPREMVKPHPQRHLRNVWA